MNIIQKRREKRKEIINRITKGLKNSIKEYGKYRLPFSFESVITAVQAKFHCARRTAIEYLNIALYNAELTSSNLPLNNRGFLMKLVIPESKNRVSK